MHDLTLFANLGLRLFPVHAPINGQCSCGNAQCGSPAKHPMVRDWPNEASADFDKLRARRKQFPGCNWGVATGLISGIVVVDVDPRHDGTESLAALEQEHGKLPPTWEVITGSGGRHLYFRHPGITVNNSAGVLGAGLDIRGDGGFVVGPTSKHISGRTYDLSVDGHPDEVPLADLPAWILAKIDRTHIVVHNGGEPVAGWRALATSIVVEGRRNETLARLAGHMLRRDVFAPLVRTLLLSFNRFQCNPPLDDAEVDAIINSIASRELARRRSHAR